MNCVFNSKFLFLFSNGVYIFVLQSGGNGKWNLHVGWFCYEKFVYDSDVDFHEMFQVVKVWHKL